MFQKDALMRALAAQLAYYVYQKPWKTPQKVLYNYTNQVRLKLHFKLLTAIY